MVRIMYVVFGNIAGAILGTVLLGILLIVGLGWGALGWALVLYGVFLIASIVMAFIDPLKMDD